MPLHPWSFIPFILHRWTFIPFILQDFISFFFCTVNRWSVVVVVEISTTTTDQENNKNFASTLRTLLLA